MRLRPNSPLPPDPAGIEPDCEVVAVASDPTRRMVAILLTLAVAVLIWPVLLHPTRPSTAKSVTAAVMPVPASRPAPPRDSTTGAWQPTESTWGEQLRSGTYWSKHAFNGGASGQSRSGLTRADRSAIPWPDMGRLQDEWNYEGSDRQGGGTYRTMCVRLCDGYYWPVSYSVTKDRFDVDADTCSRSCGGPDQARLFVYRNPGSEIDDMEDLDGRAYKKLKNAFLFKTKYEASCKCRPEPWDQASLDRHKSYALAAQAQKGDKVAASELRELRTKMRSDEKAMAATKAAQQSRSVRGGIASASNDDASAAGGASSVEAAGASVARTQVIRGSDRQSGNFRSARKPSADVADDDDDEPAPAVRVRMGNRPVVDVRVRPGRARKAAEATGSRVVKQ